MVWMLHTVWPHYHYSLLENIEARFGETDSLKGKNILHPFHYSILICQLLHVPKEFVTLSTLKCLVAGFHPLPGDGFKLWF